MTEQILNVKRTGDFFYPICFEENFDKLMDYMKELELQDRVVCVVSDSNVAPLYLETVQSILKNVSKRVSKF